jgi:hypothetical protein
MPREVLEHQRVYSFRHLICREMPTAGQYGKFVTR